MFTFLVRVIFILTSFKALALEEAYFSKAWIRLLSYQKDGNLYSSNAAHESFFVSKEGRNSPELEWKAGIRAIRESSKVGRLKKIYACSFPARYELITRIHPGLRKENRCPDFDQWSDEIGASEIYLVYASSYISNPASMFGHSFLRLSRGGKTRSDALLDYSVGFMAFTDKSDNSLIYSIKGVTGQYNGHFEIKPFYMNVGLYSNAEDRDLWQYKLDFDKKETEFLVKVLWELSSNTGFRYFFFDENCSYYMIKLLEIVKTQWNLLGRPYLFAHPIETVKWINEQSKFQSPVYIESINKELRRKLDHMSDLERSSFKRALKDEKLISKIKSQRVLDALIDYWNFYNYGQNTNISKKAKRLMNASLLQRSQLGKQNYTLPRPIYIKSNPINFHNPNKFDLMIGDDVKGSFVESKLKLGYQGLDDSNLGHDGYSYIDYIGVDFRLRDSQLLFKEVDLVQIYSLAPFVAEVPKFSWSLDIDWQNSNNFYRKKNFKVGGGFGASISFEQAVLSSFLGVDIRSWREEDSMGASFQPYLEALSVMHLDKISLNLNLKARWLDKALGVSTQNTLSYHLNPKLSLKLNIKNLVGLSSSFESSIGLRKFW